MFSVSSSLDLYGPMGNDARNSAFVPFRLIVTNRVLKAREEEMPLYPTLGQSAVDSRSLALASARLEAAEAFIVLREIVEPSY